MEIKDCMRTFYATAKSEPWFPIYSPNLCFLIGNGTVIGHQLVFTLECFSFGKGLNFRNGNFTVTSMTAILSVRQNVQNWGISALSIFLDFAPYTCVSNFSSSYLIDVILALGFI